MRSWIFYSKLFKYILEKYYNPEIKRDNHCIKYKITIDEKSSNYRYYFHTNDWWSGYNTRYIGLKDLRIECICYAALIGYE
jgi:hypothetical protein